MALFGSSGRKGAGSLGCVKGNHEEALFWRSPILRQFICSTKPDPHRAVHDTGTLCVRAQRMPLTLDVCVCVR